MKTRNEHNAPHGIPKHAATVWTDNVGGEPFRTMEGETLQRQYMECLREIVNARALPYKLSVIADDHELPSGSVMALMKLEWVRFDTTPGCEAVQWTGPIPKSEEELFRAAHIWLDTTRYYQEKKMNENQTKHVTSEAKVENMNDALRKIVSNTPQKKKRGNTKRELLSRYTDVIWKISREDAKFLAGMLAWENGIPTSCIPVMKSLGWIVTQGSAGSKWTGPKVNTVAAARKIAAELFEAVEDYQETERGDKPRMTERTTLRPKWANPVEDVEPMKPAEVVPTEQPKPNNTIQPHSLTVVEEVSFMWGLFKRKTTK